MYHKDRAKVQQKNELCKQFSQKVYFLSNFLAFRLIAFRLKSPSQRSDNTVGTGVNLHWEELALRGILVKRLPTILVCQLSYHHIASIANTCTRILRRGSIAIIHICTNLIITQ